MNYKKNMTELTMIYNNMPPNSKDKMIYIADILNFFDVNKTAIPSDLVKLWEHKLLPVDKQSKKLQVLIAEYIEKLRKRMDIKGNNFLNPDEFKVGSEYRYICDNGDEWVRMKIVLHKWEKCFYDCDTPASSWYRSDPSPIKGYRYREIRPEK